MATSSFLANAAIASNADMKSVTLAMSTALQNLADLVKVTGQANKGIPGGAAMDWTDKTGTAITTTTANGNLTGTWSGGGLAQSDVGRRIQITGAGASGGLYYGYIVSVSSVTACVVFPTPTTAVAGTATGTIGVVTTSVADDVGYEIYRFNDVLDSTNRVFIKFIYGISALAATTTGLSLKVQLLRGTLDGSGGGGNATTSILQATYFTGGIGENNLRTSYLSSSPGSLQIGMFVDAVSQNTRTVISVARFVDNAGARTDFATHLATCGITAQSQILPKLGIAFPASGALQSWCVAGISVIPSYAFDGDIAVLLVHPFVGRTANPALDVAVVKVADFGNNVNLTTTVYGASHIFKSIITANTTFNGVTFSNCAILFE